MNSFYVKFYKNNTICRSIDSLLYNNKSLNKIINSTTVNFHTIKAVASPVSATTKNGQPNVAKAKLRTATKNK